MKSFTIPTAGYSGSWTRFLGTILTVAFGAVRCDRIGKGTLLFRTATRRQCEHGKDRVGQMKEI